MRSIALASVIAITLAACGGATTAPSPTATPAAAVTSPSGATPGPAGTTAPAATAAPATARPAFLTTTLTDVRSGERFTLGGFGGKVTLVLAMAVW